MYVLQYVRCQMYLSFPGGMQEEKGFQENLG